MELQEDDFRMLASLPLLQPVQILYDFVKLDLVRQKVLRFNSRSFEDEWEESDLGEPPISLNFGAIECVLHLLS